DVQADQQRLAAAEEGQVHRVLADAVRRRLHHGRSGENLSVCRGGGGRHGRQGKQKTAPKGAVFHAITSRRGMAPRSTSGMGRPTLLMFWRSGLMPRTRQTVNSRSATDVGRSAS